MEHLQYQSADLRYFISRTYQDEWLARFPDLPTGYLDPMWFFTPPGRLPYRDGPAAPELVLVGRTERLKGPHLFLDLAWWLPRDSYSTATVIGPDSTSRSGTSSSVYLTRMIEARHLDGTVRLAGPMGSADLARVFASRAVVVLPSLIDTMNLVALEALFSGCPTVIGSAAGACRYLRERFPNVPFVEFDIHRFYASLPAVEDLLRNYDRRRAELADALRTADFSAQGPSLAEVYAAPGRSDPAARAECDDWDRRLAAVAAPTARAA
jgi:glycosyltransferase involved in cell wall biosynthesis